MVTPLTVKLNAPPAGARRLSRYSICGLKENRRLRSKGEDGDRLKERRRVLDRMPNTFFHVM